MENRVLPVIFSAVKSKGSIFKTKKNIEWNGHSTEEFEQKWL